MLPPAWQDCDGTCGTDAAHAGLRLIEDAEVLPSAKRWTPSPAGKAPLAGALVACGNAPPPPFRPPMV
ncbi:hypothetical protein Efla_000176 [Eimeria flavescens]